MFTPILGQELERREHHRRPWWVLLGLVAALAGEETVAGNVVATVKPAVGMAEAQVVPKPMAACRIIRQAQLGGRSSRTDQTVSNLYWRALENALAMAVRRSAAQRGKWRFDRDLYTYLAGFLRAPTG